MPYAIAAAAVIDAGVSIYEGNQANSTARGVANQQEYQSSVIFGEQQGFEQQLRHLLDNPQDVTKLPGYQFNFDQGASALSRQFAASGLRGSGNMGAGLVKYGQDYASNAYLQQANLLASLSGITAASSPSQGGAVAGDVTTSNNRLQMANTNNMLSELGILGGMFGKTGGGWGGSAGGVGTGGGNFGTGNI